MRILLSFLCLFLIVGCEEPQPLKLPDTFIDDWLHDGDRFQLRIRPDGTISETYIKEDQLISEMEYKVIKIYNPRRVAVIYRERSALKRWGRNGEWMPLKLRFFWIVPSPRPAEEDFLLKMSDWCGSFSDEEWDNPMKYQKEIIYRLDNEWSEAGCHSDNGYTYYRK